MKRWQSDQGNKLFLLRQFLTKFPFHSSQNYSLSNLAQFFADIQYPIGMSQVTNESPSKVLKPPGVKVNIVRN
jgi:hypothetical protein